MIPNYKRPKIRDYFHDIIERPPTDEDFEMIIYLEKLEKKYDKALAILLEYNLPCEMPCGEEEFMTKNSDFCFYNCGVDDELFKKCWDKYIEEKLKESEIK